MSGKRKPLLVLAIVFLVVALTGLPIIAKGIAARGIGGVNYGRIVFPLLISGVFFHLYKKQA